MVKHNRVNVNLKTHLRGKNEKLINTNKDWVKNEKEWIKRKVAKEEEWKTKMDELKARHVAEKEAICQNKNEVYEKIKNELEAQKKKNHDSSNEINKLARFVNIFGKI